MDPLILTSVTIANGVTVVNAETDTAFQFLFNRNLLPSEQACIRCYVFEPVFELDYYLDDFVLAPEPPSESGEALPAAGYARMIKFPEALAGAEVRMKFYLKSDPNSLAAFATVGVAETPPPPNEPVIRVVRIRRQGNAASVIQEVYWGIDDGIRYGNPSPPRTTTLHLNETGYLHVYTRGLYGRDIRVQITPFAEQKCRVKNNTCLYVFSVPANTPYLASHNLRRLTGQARRMADAAYTRRSVIQLDPTTDGPVIPVTTAILGRVGTDIWPLSVSRVDCRVVLRPDIDYDGSFGFSWFREDDLYAYGGAIKRNDRTDESVFINPPCNEQFFGFIMGRHFDTPLTPPGPRTSGVVIQDGNESSHFFDPDPVMVENHKLDYKKIHMSALRGRQEYLVPVMTLRQGKEARLRLFIEARQEVRQIEFEFDNPKAVSEGYLTIEPTVIKPIGVMPYGKTDHTVTITCHKEFSKELMLRVKAYPVLKDINDLFPEICGAVRLLPNDPSHQRKLKVVFFNVKTRLDGLNEKKGLEEGEAEPRKEEIRRFLGQAYIEMENIEKVDLDITSGRVRPADAQPDPRYAAAIHRTYVLDAEPGNVPAEKNAFNPDKNRRVAFCDFLYDCISQPPYNRYLLENYYILFFLGDPCLIGTVTFNASGGGIYSISNSTGGFMSQKHERLCVLYADPKPEVPTHELCHALGLPHTFDGNTSRAKYVYQDGMTDNIMDYSHHVGVTRQSLFHWQWKAINSKLP